MLCKYAARSSQPVPSDRVPELQQAVENIGGYELTVTRRPEATITFVVEAESEQAALAAGETAVSVVWRDPFEQSASLVARTLDDGHDGHA